MKRLLADDGDAIIEVGSIHDLLKDIAHELSHGSMVDVQLIIWSEEEKGLAEVCHSLTLTPADLESGKFTQLCAKIGEYKQQGASLRLLIHCYPVKIPRYGVLMSPTCWPCSWHN